MKNWILGRIVHGLLRLLSMAPGLSARLMGLVTGNKKLKAFAARPLLVRRAAEALLHNGVLLSQLNVTNACNEKCPMCNLWEEGTRMPLDQVKLCIDRIAEMGSFILTITGGEPFTHPDIGEIIDYARDKPFFLNLNTNASLPLKVYQRADLDKIDLAIVSFHALDELKLERITGVRGTLARVVDTLRYFRDETTMRVVLKFVIQRDNRGEVEKVQEFADREGFTVEYHPVMVDGANRPVTTDKTELLLGQEEYMDTLLRIREIKKTGRNFESSVYYDFCLKAARRGSWGWGCDAGINYLSVYPDGRFGICKDVYTSAKITDVDFPDRYRSGAFQEEMRALRESCSGCNWSCYVTASKLAGLARNPDLREFRLLQAI
ncbi:MAG: radical SAM protein [Nitrospirae bacterium]|nr:radical SAM protein [Nitrospirota bacterium]